MASKAMHSTAKSFWPNGLQCPFLSQSSLLPFLYQTRTLQLHRPREFPNGTAPQSRPHRQFSSTTCKAVYEDAIPFDKPPDFLAVETDDTNPALRYLSKIRQRPRDSTITNSEQAVFDRIFKDIATASNIPRKHPSDEIEPEDGAYFENLDQIFENAISKNERPDLVEVRVPTEPNYRRHPLLLNIPGLESFGRDLPPPKDWGRPGKIGSESISDLSKAHEQHRTKVFGMLDAAETDVEVWRVLEKEVFILIHELNTRISDSERAAKGLKNKATKKDKPGLEARKVGRPLKEAIAATKAGEGNTSKALPPTVLLSILTKEYPDYLIACCRLLRRCFPQSPYPFAILSQVKRLGPVSYVLGASANLYNETLYLLWTSKNDLHGMADLLQEMRNQGVESNDVTLTFLNGVKRRRSYELSGQNGVWRQNWWQMGPVAEGWDRLWSGMQFVEQEQRQRRVRAAEEERDGKEVEGELLKDATRKMEEVPEEELEPVSQPVVQLNV